MRRRRERRRNRDGRNPIDTLNIAHILPLALNHGSHIVGGLELKPVDTNDRNETRNVENEILISRMQSTEIIESNASLAVSGSELNASETFFRRDVEMHDEIGFAHKVGHVMEKRKICPIFTLGQMSLVAENFGENGVFEDASVLDATFALPDDLLVLFESVVEQIHLQRKRKSCHVFVEILQIFVFADRLVAHWQLHQLSP